MVRLQLDDFAIWKNLTEGRVEIVPLALPPEIID